MLRYLLPTTYYLILTAYYLLPTTYYLLYLHAYLPSYRPTNLLIYQQRMLVLGGTYL